MSATENTEPRSLFKKLAEVMAAVEGVEKRGRNEHFKYDYATAEDTLRAIRGPLAERQVMLMASVLSSQREDTLTTVRLRFTFVDGESGEAHESEWEGTGEDRSDKGHYKAYTGAIKTFLRETFLLPAGDDPEADGPTAARASQTSNGSAPADSAPAGPASSDKRISEGKARRAWAIKKEHRWTNEDWTALLASYGISDPAELHFKAYDEFIETVERKRPVLTGEPDVPVDTEGPTDAQMASSGPDIPF